ncbi:hypothetical protein KJ359_000065 [Pestalotiopsis sp. 9143b]|nr:hypothetical protein KJ359_000065 [Pestalotiopsis sp. 9143b]
MANRVWIAVLTQDTFIPASIPSQSQNTPEWKALGQLRFRTNINIIFEAVCHFLDFYGAPNFWTLIRETLGFDRKTTESHLKDIVLAYCEGRDHYQEKRGIALRTKSRLEKLAEWVIEQDDHPEHDYKRYITHRDWDAYLFKWKSNRLPQIKNDLGVTERQLANGTCAPELRPYAPLTPSLASRISAPPSSDFSPVDIKHFDATSPRASSPSPTGRNTEMAKAHSFTHPLPQKPQIQSAENLAGHAETGSSNERKLPTKTPTQPSMSTSAAKKPNDCAHKIEQRAQKINSAAPPTNAIDTGPSPGSVRTPAISASQHGRVEGQQIRKRGLSEVGTDSPRKRVATEHAAHKEAEQKVEASASDTEVKGSHNDKVENTTNPQTAPAAAEASKPAAESSTEMIGQQLLDGGEPMQIESSETPSPPHNTTSKVEESREDKVSQDQSKLLSCESLDTSSTIHDQGGLNHKSDGPDVVRELITSLEMRQRRLEEMETSMRTWQEQLTKNFCSDSQNRIQKLEKQVETLTSQFEQSNQEKVSSTNLLTKELEHNSKQWTMNRQRIANMEDFMKMALGDDANAIMARFSALETRIAASKNFGNSEREQIIEMQTDIMGINNRLDALPGPQHFDGLKNIVHIIEGRLKAHITAAPLQQSTTKDSLRDLEESHSKLRAEVTQRTDEFESALAALQKNATKQSSNSNSINDLITEWEEFRANKPWKRSIAALKETVKDLASGQKDSEKSLSQQTEELNANRERLQDLTSKLEKLQGRGTEVVQADAAQNLTKALDNRSMSDDASKRLDTVEVQLNRLNAAIGALERHISENVSGDRVHKLEVTVQEMRNAAQDHPAMDSMSVDVQLSEIREYVDHTLEMAKAAMMKRLDGFQVQINDRLSMVQGTEQLVTPTSPQPQQFPMGVAPPTFSQGQARDALPVRRESSSSSRFSSPSLSELESLISQSNQPKVALENTLVALKTIKRAMRTCIRGMDAAGVVDDHNKMSVSDVSFEIEKIALLAKSCIQNLR